MGLNYFAFVTVSICFLNVVNSSSVLVHVKYCLL